MTPPNKGQMGTLSLTTVPKKAKNMMHVFEGYFQKWPKMAKMAIFAKKWSFLKFLWKSFEKLQKVNFLTTLNNRGILDIRDVGNVEKKSCRWQFFQKCQKCQKWPFLRFLENTDFFSIKDPWKLFFIFSKIPIFENFEKC